MPVSASAGFAGVNGTLQILSHHLRIAGLGTQVRRTLGIPGNTLLKTFPLLQQRCSLLLLLQLHLYLRLVSLIDGTAGIGTAHGHLTTVLHGEHDVPCRILTGNGDTERLTGNHQVHLTALHEGTAVGHALHSLLHQPAVFVHVGVDDIFQHATLTHVLYLAHGHLLALTSLGGYQHTSKGVVQVPCQVVRLAAVAQLHLGDAPVGGGKGLQVPPALLGILLHLPRHGIVEAARSLHHVTPLLDGLALLGAQFPAVALYEPVSLSIVTCFHGLHHIGPQMRQHWVAGREQPFHPRNGQLQVVVHLWQRALVLKGCRASLVGSLPSC